MVYRYFVALLRTAYIAFLDHLDAVCAFDRRLRLKLAQEQVKCLGSLHCSQSVERVGNGL